MYYVVSVADLWVNTMQFGQCQFSYLEPVLWIVAGYANLPQLFWLAI